ncbi:MFS transporter [Janibacter alittae]|uniref:MFS transporter n=1 Tax=Janibacter alittae TaxID=3115209 RepID=A0ABZ2MFN3_9MICO
MAVNGDEPGIELDSPKGRTVLSTVVLGSAVASLTATVVNVALPALAADLGANSSGQKWIINGYTLTLAAFILVGGSLGDRYGRLRIYRVGVVWFAVASLLCALAWNTEALVGFRLLQGVGGALLTPGSLAIIESSLRRADRGRGVGAWSGITGLAGAIGPLLGGLLVEISWRWVFVVNVPVAIAVVVLSRWVPETIDPRARHSRLDLRGAALSALVLGAVSYAFIEGPERGFSIVEKGAVVVGALGVVALWVAERRHEQPMLPLDLFGVRAFAVANVLTFVIYGGMGVMFFLLSIQLQVTAGWSALEAGTALLPVTLIMLVLSSRAGDLSQKIGPRWPLTIGPIVMAVGMVMMTRAGPDASFLTDVLPAVTVFGFGLTSIVAPVTTTALGAAPDERAGAASGTNNAVARTGGLLAVAAIPSLVGLTGDALSTPALLDPGFDRAMWVSAAVVAGGGVLALFLLRSDDLAAGPADDTREDVAAGRTVQRHACPVDGELTSTSGGG